MLCKSGLLKEVKFKPRIYLIQRHLMEITWSVCDVHIRALTAVITFQKIVLNPYLVCVIKFTLKKHSIICIL